MVTVPCIGRFPFSLKFRQFSVGNQMQRTILVPSDRNIQDHLGKRSTLTSLFGRSDRNVPFHLRKLIGSVLKSTISRRDVTWVGSVHPMFISIGQTGIFVQRKAPLSCFHRPFFENISFSCLTTQFIYFHIKDFALRVIQYGNTLFIRIQSRHHFEENQLLPHGRPNNSKRFSS